MAISAEVLGRARALEPKSEEWTLVDVVSNDKLLWRVFELLNKHEDVSDPAAGDMIKAYKNVAKAARACKWGNAKVNEALSALNDYAACVLVDMYEEDNTIISKAYGYQKQKQEEAKERLAKARAAKAQLAQS